MNIARASLRENGKSVVVRTEDGIHFTRDGQNHFARFGVEAA